MSAVILETDEAVRNSSDARIDIVLRCVARNAACGLPPSTRLLGLLWEARGKCRKPYTFVPVGSTQHPTHYHPKLLNLGGLRGRIFRAPRTHKKQQSGAARNIRNHCEMGGLRSFGEEQRELLRDSQISIRKQTNQNPHVIPLCFLTKNNGRQ